MSSEVYVISSLSSPLTISCTILSFIHYLPLTQISFFIVHFLISTFLGTSLFYLNFWFISMKLLIMFPYSSPNVCRLCSNVSIFTTDFGNLLFFYLYFLKKLFYLEAYTFYFFIFPQRTSFYRFYYIYVFYFIDSNSFFILSSFFFLYQV